MSQIRRQGLVSIHSGYDHVVLIRLAAKAGIDKEEAAQTLAGNGYADAVKNDIAEAHGWEQEECLSL